MNRLCLNSIQSIYLFRICCNPGWPPTWHPPASASPALGFTGERPHAWWFRFFNITFLKSPFSLAPPGPFLKHPVKGLSCSMGTWCLPLYPATWSRGHDTEGLLSQSLGGWGGIKTAGHRIERWTAKTQITSQSQKLPKNSSLQLCTAGTENIKHMLNNK